MQSAMELRHLGREVKTALELAIVAPGPVDLVERLAMMAGLLEAISDLPVDSPAVAALIPALDTRAHAALTDWEAWRKKHLQRISA